MPHDLDDRSTALYRLTDAAGQLLYVGVTTDPEERFRKHAALSPWWHLVTERAIDWRSTRQAALDAETDAIRDERPLYNRAGSETRQAATEAFPVGREVSTAELRARLSDVVRATSRGQVTYITKNGRPWVAFVPVDAAEEIEQQRLA